MHLKSIPILPEQLDVPGGDKRLNLRGPADRRDSGVGGEAAGGAAVRRGRGGGRRWSGGAGGGRGSGGRRTADGGRNGRDLPGCRRMANPDHFQTVFSRKTVAKRQAVAEQQIPTILGGLSRLFWSQNARLPQHGKSRPFREAQREEAHQKENHQKEATRKEAHQKETQQKKGAAGGDPCRCDELFAWRAATPPQAPPRRAPQRTPRPQRARCRDTPSLPGWTRRRWPHR